MRYIAAYMLAAMGGNKNPSANDIKEILASVGVEAEEENINRVINELKGKNLEDVIEQGQKKLAVVANNRVAQDAQNTEIKAENVADVTKADGDSDGYESDQSGFGNLFE